MTPLEQFKAWTRPIVCLVAGLGTVAGLFTPAATAEKMMVTAALAGVYVWSRMKEKIAGKA